VDTEKIVFSLLKKGFEVIGIDSSQQSIHNSMQLSKIENMNIHFINASFMDFPANNYDLIICKGVLHFIDDKTNFIKKMQDVTSKNGINLVTALNVDLKKYYSDWEILFDKVDGKENMLIARLK
jgi:2-polyprenyl-3-methyl-5-hydroxy-6-metoxy-1,4-benzoquinol methylase